MDIKRVVDELVEFKDSYLAGMLPSPTAQGPSKLNARQIKVANLASVNSNTGDLTITGTLTLGDGGSIVDADGSVWNQDGITFKAVTTTSDFISFRNNLYNHKLDIKGFITSVNTNLQMEAQYISNPQIGPDFNSASTIGASSTSAVANISAAEAGGKTAYVQCSADTTRSLADIVALFGNVRFAFQNSVIPSGTGVIWIDNSLSVPSSNPSSGGILYVESGALKYRGSSGTITTIAAA